MGHLCVFHTKHISLSHKHTTFCLHTFHPFCSPTILLPSRLMPCYCGSTFFVSWCWRSKGHDFGHMNMNYRSAGIYILYLQIIESCGGRESEISSSPNKIACSWNWGKQSLIRRSASSGLQHLVVLYVSRYPGRNLKSSPHEYKAGKHLDVAWILLYSSAPLILKLANYIKYC